MKKYYEVTAKCGHVGRNNYIYKKFYTCADSKADAADLIRWAPRVKHHHKDAIKEVKEISEYQYIIGNQKNSCDPYFTSKNKQEQNKLHAVNEDEIIKEAQSYHYKKKCTGQHLKYNARVKEFIKSKQGGFMSYVEQD